MNTTLLPIKLDDFVINKSIASSLKNINSSYIENLGTTNYYSFLKSSILMLGNSSSGIIEVPSLKIPCIDIGDRQGGRIRGKGIIKCLPNKKAIASAIKKGLSKSFINNLSFNKNPYEKKDTSKKILNILIKSNLSNILKKQFIDL